MHVRKTCSRFLSYSKVNPYFERHSPPEMKPPCLFHLQQCPQISQITASLTIKYQLFLHTCMAVFDLGPSVTGPVLSPSSYPQNGDYSGQGLPLAVLGKELSIPESLFSAGCWSEIAHSRGQKHFNRSSVLH